MMIPIGLSTFGAERVDATRGLHAVQLMLVQIDVSIRFSLHVYSLP